MANYLPKGFRDYLFDRADALAYAVMRVSDVYTRWGYRRFIPSSVEDAATFGHAAGEDLLRQSFRFADRTGELLVLRSDFTLQSARAIAGELHDVPPPIRLAYADRVYRHVQDGRGAVREAWQAGVELAGAEGPEADAEIVAVTLEALGCLGLSELRLDFGHAGFIREFLRLLPTEVQGDAASALQRKDARALLDLRRAGRLNEEAYTASCALLESFGGTVPSDSQGILPAATEAVEQLQAISRVLSAYGIEVETTYDPGEVRGLDYYTGFFFHIYHPGISLPVAAGGRYDGLLCQYGRDLPAVGSAIDLTALASRLTASRASRIHIVNFRDSREAALGFAKALRSEGYDVSRDIVKRPLPQSVAFAQAMGIQSVLVLHPGARVELVRLADDERADSLERLVQRLSQGISA